MVNGFDQMSLLCELTQGRELANRLKDQLDPVSSSKTCEALLQKIVSTYDKALSMLNCRGNLKRGRYPEAARLELDSSRSTLANSPTSDCSDHFASNDQQSHEHAIKKRKTLPRRSELVRVCSGAGLEGPVSDGHGWRKYGQKDILGAKFPRSYYRCTHRHTRGCLATKQVQRSDEDPSTFEVTYKGWHSCIRASNLPATVDSVEEESAKPKTAKPSLDKKDSQMQAQPPTDMPPHLRQGLKVEAECSNTSKEIFPFFSFPLIPIESENVESQFFSDAMKESDLMGSYSPAFLSPTTSESNYCPSECQINVFGIANIPQSSKLDLADGISTPTSVTKSPFGDLDLSLDQVDFDPTFSLDNLAYFS